MLTSYSNSVINMFLLTTIFLLGLTVGSFLNVLIYRLPRTVLSKRLRTVLGSIVYGRSKCPKCKHVLAWYDLVPLFSFIFLKGRCRYCKKPFSGRYFFVEILTGLLFLTFFALQRPGSLYGYLDLSFWLFVFSTLLVLAFIDLDYFIIIDKILIVLVLITFLYQVFRKYVVLAEPATIGGIFNIYPNLLTAFLSGLIFLLIFWATKGRGIGLGDVKFIFVLGFLLGFPGILIVVYLSLLAGMIWGLALILFFGASMKSKIAFGFILANAAIVFMLFNQFLTAKFAPYIFRLYL
ncbi:MAG: prepilin peptidase [Candidatus Yanofskybacteria bacterium]|nr:prepilin peptidase [Candidatus Yanofskybacteria bacterium]